MLRDIRNLLAIRLHHINLIIAVPVRIKHDLTFRRKRKSVIRCLIATMVPQVFAVSIHRIYFKIAVAGAHECQFPGWLFQPAPGAPVLLFPASVLLYMADCKQFTGFYLLFIPVFLLFTAGCC